MTRSLFLIRLAAMFYDSIVILALLLFGTLLLLPFTHGQAISPTNDWYKGYLVALWAGYFIECWHLGGQTLGMRAWKVKLRSTTTNPITFTQALQRFLLAFPSLLCVLGFFFKWHDKFSQTTLVSLSANRPDKSKRKS